jgi:hypothetical protein
VSKFITEEVDAVKVEGDPNTIFIRKKLNLGQTQLVQSAAMRAEEGRLDDASVVTAMWVAYIARWDGPDFKGLKCVAHNISQLNPDDPLVEAVGDMIAQRWKLKIAESTGDEQAKNSPPAGS